MSKTTKVVPIENSKRRIVAADETTNRYIMHLGSTRVAFDFTTRVTRLDPTTGDAPAKVITLPKQKAKKGSRQPSIPASSLF